MTLGKKGLAVQETSARQARHVEPQENKGFAGDLFLVTYLVMNIYCHFGFNLNLVCFTFNTSESC